MKLWDWTGAFETWRFWRRPSSSRDNLSYFSLLCCPMSSDPAFWWNFIKVFTICRGRGEIDFMGCVFGISVFSLAKSSITLIKIGPQGSKFSEWRELKTFGSKKIEISWDSELRSNKLMGWWPLVQMGKVHFRKFSLFKRISRSFFAENEGKEIILPSLICNTKSSWERRGGSKFCPRMAKLRFKYRKMM